MGVKSITTSVNTQFSAIGVAPSILSAVKPKDAVPPAGIGVVQIWFAKLYLSLSFEINLQFQ